MNYNKGIWKTGALAVFVTVAFAMFIFRIAEWTRGLNSDVAVYGQTAATTAGTTVTKIIPQIAVGSFDGGMSTYTTVIQIVNTNATAVRVTGNFYTQAGTASHLLLTGVDDGVLPSTSIPARGVLVIKGEPASGATTGEIAWGKLMMVSAVSVMSFYEVRKAQTNELYSRVGVQASPADMASFVVPRSRNVAVGLDIAFAIVNTGSTQATLNATLHDAAGAAISKKSASLNPGQQTVLFAQQFFGLTNEPHGANYQYVVFESTAPQFAALALAFEGPTQTSFPVDKLR
jgi:hypothetical protein